MIDGPRVGRESESGNTNWLVEAEGLKDGRGKGCLPMLSQSFTST